MMTPEEVHAWDLRNSCYHECAHMVVARHYRLVAWIDVERHAAQDPLLDELERHFSETKAIPVRGWSTSQLRVYSPSPAP